MALFQQFKEGVPTRPDSKQAQVSIQRRALKCTDDDATLIKLHQRLVEAAARVEEKEVAMFQKKMVQKHSEILTRQHELLAKIREKKILMGGFFRNSVGGINTESRITHNIDTEAVPSKPRRSFDLKSIFAGIKRGVSMKKNCVKKDEITLGASRAIPEAEKVSSFFHKGHGRPRRRSMGFSLAAAMKRQSSC